MKKTVINQMIYSRESERTMRELVRQFNDLHPSLEDKENMTEENYFEHATRLAGIRDEILFLFDDDDWNELLKMPYPVQYRIVLKKLQKKISGKRTRR